MIIKQQQIQWCKNEIRIQEKELCKLTQKFKKIYPMIFNTVHVVRRLYRFIIYPSSVNELLTYSSVEHFC